jgi:hypothetical protein
MAALRVGIGGTFLDAIGPYEENARRGDRRPPAVAASEAMSIERPR